MKTRSLEQKPVAPVPARVQQPSPLRNFLADWDKFWFSSADPTSLGLMRLLGGIVILYVHLCYTYDLLSYVGHDQAWLDARGSDVVRYQLPMQAFSSDWTGQGPVVATGRLSWSVFFHLHDPFWIYTAHYCLLGVMVLFTIGLWTRVTTVLTFCAILQYIHRQTVMLFGMDTMMLILVFYLMLAPAGAALSVDRLIQIWRAKRRHGPGYVPPPPQPSISAGFVLRCLQVHFCFIYIGSGTSKLLGSAWWNGTAVWYCFINYEFAPLGVGLYYDGLVFLCHHRWLWALVMTGGVVFTLFVEIGFAFLVWLPRWRWVMVSGSVLLHTGIGLFMGLITFSMFMLLLVMAFIPPEAVKHQLAQLGEQSKRLWQGFLPKQTRRDKPAALVMSR